LSLFFAEWKLNAGHWVMPCRCEDESIDELAAFLGVGDEVAAMTARYVYL
jgi:hypothetical protein